MAALLCRSLKSGKDMVIARELILEQISKCEKKSFSRTETLDFDVEFKKRNVEFFVYLEDDANGSSVHVVAYLAIAHVKPGRSVVLNKICVEPTYRSKGLGTALLGDLVVNLRRRGKSTLQLWADERNTVALKLYGRLGFETNDRTNLTSSREGTRSYEEGQKAISGAMLYLFLCYLSIDLVQATPSVNLPINAQVPPVGRVYQPFDFVFSDSTFTSTSTISYALANAPSWLTLDGPSRTFSGSPAIGNVGSAVVSLVAKDAEGSVSMPFTIVVTNETGPQIGLSLASQLSLYGAFSAPNRLLLAPSNPLLIPFSGHTFTNINEKTVYYATIVDHTPLPSWIHFDSSNLTLSGTAPQAVSPLDKTQIFGIRISASNVVGFADAIAQFEIVIENHLLTFSDTALMIYVRTGSSVKDSTIANNLFLDGRPISSSQVMNATLQTPSWFYFDPQSLQLSGNVPWDFRQQNSTVTITDIYGDSASAMVILQSAASSMKSLLKPIGTANATMGTYFVYHLGETITNSISTLKVDLGSASAWLEFDDVKRDIRGRVPDNIRPQQAMINITATSGSEQQSQVLTIAIQEPGSRTIDSLVFPTSSSNSASPSAVGTGPTASSSRKPWIAAIVVPVLFMLTLTSFLGLYWLKRRRERQWLFTHSSPSSSDRHISRPMIQEKDLTKSQDVAEEELKGTKRRLSKLSRAPQIPELFHFSTKPRPARLVNRGESTKSSLLRPFNSDSLNSSRRLSTAPSRIFTTLEASENAPNEEVGPAVPPHQTTNSKKPRTRREQSNASLGSSGLLYTQFMLKGFGHGKPDPSRSFVRSPNPTRGHRYIRTPFDEGPPGFGPVRKSWKYYKTSHSSDDWATTSSSSNQDTKRLRRATIRRVSRTSTSSWPNTSEQLQIPKSARMRQSSQRFMSGRNVRGRRSRPTRSRSSSLGPPMRPNSDISPERSRRFPRVLRVLEGMPGSITRSSLASNGSRFQSVAPSELGSFEFEFIDDLDRSDVRPGLSIAEHRHGSPLTDLANRLTHMEPASDDRSSILGLEDTTTAEPNEDSEDVRFMTRGQRLGRQVGMGQSDPANRSLKGRIETAESFSTGRADSDRSGSRSFV